MLILNRIKKIDPNLINLKDYLLEIAILLINTGKMILEKVELVTKVKLKKV